MEVSIEDMEEFEGIEESTVLVEVKVDERSGSQEGNSSIQESMT